jgi:hypothetical protein
MNKSRLIYVLVVLLIAACGGCSNVCQDPHSINFNQAGKCIDVTGDAIGTYSGTLQDSSASGAAYYNVVIKISKVNNTNVSVQLLSPAGTPFTPFTAAVSTNSVGYYLAVNSDSATVTGAAAAYGSQADGVYFSYNKQLSFYALSAGGTFEAFRGTKQ